MKNKDLQYETIKNGWINKNQAIAIAGYDRCLKDSIFIDFKKDGIVLGLISFHEFDVALVKFYDDFAWHVKVKSGEWGGIKYKKIPILGKKIIQGNWDGFFTLESNISCFITCNRQEYYYYKEVDMSKVKPLSMDEYKKYINIYYKK